jgi:hypothetical protein
MALFRYTPFLAFLLSLSVALNLPRDAHAVPTVWSGPTITFTKMGFDPTDTTDPLNQDRLTNNVWLTRGGSEGIFNVAPGREAAYIRYTSPADTQWATSVMSANTGKTIAAANWAQLSFTDWAPSYGGPGSALGANITTHNAVVHLLTDDIYLDLSFSFFTSGGDFTYTRSTPAVAVPTGDYNHNGTVDAADYVIWRHTFGNSVAPFGSGADGNSNGGIDLGDYAYWRERYGNAPVGVGSGLASIPEPATFPFALQLIAVVLCMFRWRSLTRLRYATINMRRHPMTMPRIDSRCFAITLVIVALLAGATPTVNAAFHLWQVKEVFTNVSGSVQFVEMFDSFSGETLVNGATLTANSDGNIKTFKFPGNLSNPTPGSLLIATTGFGSLPGGVTPDFTFDQSTTPFTGSFFNPNATSITFTYSGIPPDSMTITGTALPKDGIRSLTDAGAVGSPPGTPNISSGTNSPTNLLGNSGSVNLSAPSPTGDYNGNHTVDAADYAVWRKTLNGTVSPNGSGADGSSDGQINDADYTFWRARFGNAAPGSGAVVSSLVPEPLAAVLLLMSLPAMWIRRTRR